MLSDTIERSMSDLQKLLVLLNEPQSHAAESYRGLRTSLQRALSSGVKSIMFVSTFGGDGKSMVCANVAVALTQLFLDVILVDCDLRKPTNTNLFDALDQAGLSDFLAGRAKLDQVIHPAGIERLRIVPSGMTGENPSDLLGRPSLAEFCKQASEIADVVIFDTSPLSACSDALSLGPLMDTSIMVVNPRQWDGDVEVKARQSLETHGIAVMGVILNGTDPGEAYGYGYSARYGSRYGYGSNRPAYGYGYGVPEGPEQSANDSSSRRPRSWRDRLAGWWGG